MQVQWSCRRKTRWPLSSNCFNFLLGSFFHSVHHLRGFSLIWVSSSLWDCLPFKFVLHLRLFEFFLHLSVEVVFDFSFSCILSCCPYELVLHLRLLSVSVHLLYYCALGDCVNLFIWEGPEENPNKMHNLKCLFKYIDTLYIKVLMKTDVESGSNKLGLRCTKIMTNLTG